ncbi:hypothetical protein VNO80_02059 [Phaseolus coccineus]|uniref:Uncharacterized protein n=1 Tax=Phaseolus coccineus TaxID=3886 RepID=A0AAN9NQG7_PHACN
MLKDTLLQYLQDTFLSYLQDTFLSAPSSTTSRTPLPSRFHQTYAKPLDQPDKLDLITSVERPLNDRQSLLECKNRDFYSVLVYVTKREEDRQRMESQQRKEGLVAKNRLMAADDRGRQLHAMGLTDVPKVDPDSSSIAAALMDMYQSIGDDALAQQCFRRQGKWKATTQSRGFLKSIKRYYSNAYTDGYFQPHEGKPALWELDSDYYLHVCGIGDDLIPEKCSEPNPKPSGRGGIIFTPIPACREDFLWIKLTSFDKLIEKTCSTIRNVRLCSEPDQRPGGTSGNSGVAPDLAFLYWYRTRPRFSRLGLPDRADLDPHGRTGNVGLHFERRPNIRRVYERRNKGVKRNVEESNCVLDRFLYWYRTRLRFSRLGLPDRADLDPHRWDFSKDRDFGRKACPLKVEANMFPKSNARADVCKVTTTWFGFYRIWRGNNQIFDTVDLALPHYSYESQAVWVPVPPSIKEAVVKQNYDFRGGLHAASHAILHETATCFINRLMDEYAAYSDIIQPIQVAVYEMKFGLSLILSCTLEKKCLNTLGNENITVVTEMMYTLMRFPRAASCKFISVNHDIELDMHPAYSLESATGFCLVDMDLMERLVTLSSGVVADKMLLHKIFDEFARLWLSTKAYAKSKSDFDAQQYKFRPRAFQIESMVSSEECSTLDEEWKQLEESILSHVIHIHNQIFGSSDRIQNPGIFEVFDEDRLHSVMESYSLGIDLIKGVHSINLLSLDAKLMPEHLFYLCLDYRKKYLLSHKSATRYNFYKDSNAPKMVHMLNVLGPLQQQILPHINEWEVHNDLQKFLDVIDMLLTLPSDTTLAKGFSGLQFLLHKAEVMQENGSKFPFSNSWPALLDEVMDQYENNAAKVSDLAFCLRAGTGGEEAGIWAGDRVGTSPKIETLVGKWAVLEMFLPCDQKLDLADFGMGMNVPAPAMSREEFEACKADTRRKRENGRRGERSSLLIQTLCLIQRSIRS